MRMPLLSCAERRNLYALLTGATALLMAEGVQRLAHMAPEGPLACPHRALVRMRDATASS
jgi:hypothetical protein